MRRKKFWETTEKMQVDLAIHLKTYDHSRPQRGRGMNDRTPMRAFSGESPSKEKQKMMKKAA